MTEIERKTIEIPEICRVEGHAAVQVDIQDGQVVDVRLDVFEGTRFFEKIVVTHKYDEMAHITSRVCAICSTGHVLASINAIERAFAHEVKHEVKLYRELMHLGMIIESHATHICALALPDFLGTPDLLDFATKHQDAFGLWTKLRKLGAAVQTLIGGRPFHPVNLHVGGLSRYPQSSELQELDKDLLGSLDLAVTLCKIVSGFSLPVERTSDAAYLALIQEGKHYNYFGDSVQCSEGWKASIDEYKEYLGEETVPYSHAKKSSARGKRFMVGSLARLAFFAEKLSSTAFSIYRSSVLAQGQKNTILNNLAQAIEVVDAIERSHDIIQELLQIKHSDASAEIKLVQAKAGKAAGAVECPRGTLYHYYALDDAGVVLEADMITPSAQNTARIEADIRTVVQDQYGKESPEKLQSNLETLIRAYDPCNTCATHMVRINLI